MLLPRIFLGCFPGILELSVTSAVQVSLCHCCISPTPFLMNTAWLFTWGPEYAGASCNSQSIICWNSTQASELMSERAEMSAVTAVPRRFVFCHRLACHSSHIQAAQVGRSRSMLKESPGSAVQMKWKPPALVQHSPINLFRS